MDKDRSVSQFRLKYAGILYKAYDLAQRCETALKVEKKDKSRRILENEYDFLRRL